jgi:hypothetical protein
VEPQLPHYIREEKKVKAQKREYPYEYKYRHLPLFLSSLLVMSKNFSSTMMLRTFPVSCPTLLWIMARVAKTMIAVLQVS